MTAHLPMNPDGPRPMARDDAAPAPERKEHKRRRLERTQMGLVVGAVALSLLVGIAGVPGVEEPEAGNGTVALRRGWADNWAAEAAAEAPTEAPDAERKASLSLERAPSKR